MTKYYNDKKLHRLFHSPYNGGAIRSLTGRTCSMHWLIAKCAQSFGRKTWIYELENVGINAVIILQWILGIWREPVEWIHLARDKF
jgi:hypothetical protein